MQRLLEAARRWYRLYVRGLSYLGDILLLVVRLYWGSLLVQSGWYKFANLQETARYFESLGIFWPKFNAILSGGVELGFGALLVIGLAARIAAVPLAINFVVAYLTNSADAIRHLFVNANEFVTSPEFLFLFACVLILVFGPGLISVDGLLGIFLGRVPAEGWRARLALGAAKSGEQQPGAAPGGTPTNVLPDRRRREFAKLAAAAFAGLFAGIVVGRSGRQGPNAEKPQAAGEPGKPAPTEAKPRTKPAATNENVAAKIPTPPGTDIALLWSGDVHVCRGLNTCRGKDKKHDNTCAGRGTCATAETHACNGQNACKGQGGCDSTAGINTCKGKGAAPCRSRKRRGRSPATASSSSPKRSIWRSAPRRRRARERGTGEQRVRH